MRNDLPHSPTLDTKKHPDHPTRAVLSFVVFLSFTRRLAASLADRAAMSEKENLDGDGQAGVQCDDGDEQDLGRFDVGGREDGVSAE